MDKKASRIPVIVGVGQLNDRPSDPIQGLDSLELVEAALKRADADGGGNWLLRIDSLGVVPQISCPDLSDIPEALASRLGIVPKLCYQTDMPSGDSPLLLLAQAANRIANGDGKVAAVVGGEALRTGAQRACAPANAVRSSAARRISPLRSRYGLIAPIDIYPLYENATRAAWGQTLAEGQSESGAIWSEFSEVASSNPAAWIQRFHTSDEIVTPTAGNRLLAFPYTKLMVANASVNQGAGFIVTSLAEARAAGVPAERLVFIGRGAAAHETDDILAREHFDRSRSMEVSLRQAMTLNGVTTEDLDLVELYSCFPCVPKMARRVIGWPLNKPATVFGGLTFGGGPIGNYMSHAVVSMVEKMREGARRGLLFANGGLATHNHALLLSRESLPPDTLPHDFDVQAMVEEQRDPMPPLVETYHGSGTIETYTVLFERDGSPKFGVVVGRTPSGERFLAKVPADDEAGIAFLVDGRREPVGTTGEAVAGPDGDVLWQTSASI